MKNQTIALLGLVFLAASAFVGCSLTGTNPKPLSQFEERYFTPTTNYVTVTNLVVRTNITGGLEARAEVTTNEIYTVKPSLATKEIATTAGAVVNTFAPGIGSMVTAGLLGLTSIWGYLRSTKRGQANSALTQEIETLLAFVQTLPNGSVYKDVLTKFLATHQAEAGVINQVLDVIQKDVDARDAKVTAQELQAKLAELLKQTQPPKA